VVAAHDHSCAITEQYRAVRTWLLRRNATGRHECIAITSSIPREGKSVTTANLAVVMSEVRHMKVLAMDFDLRQGSLAKLYKLSGAPGLADVLAGEASLEEAMTTTPFGNLSFLPAGICRGRNPAELVNSKTAAHVFEEIRERFHFTRRGDRCAMHRHCGDRPDEQDGLSRGPSVPPLATSQQPGRDRLYRRGLLRQGGTIRIRK
jgi:Mrp family chromosome partitioning ATPase